MTEIEFLKEQEEFFKLRIKTSEERLRFSRECLAAVQVLLSHMNGQPDGTGCLTDQSCDR